MMARCGRCGLWSAYPEDHPEEKWAGVCLWYQLQLREGDVFAQRDCDDFFERVPGVKPMAQFEYKVKRDALRDGWLAARRAKTLAIIGIVLSSLGLLWNVVKLFLE